MNIFNESISDIEDKKLFDKTCHKLLITEMLLSVAQGNYNNMTKIGTVLDFSFDELEDIIQEIYKIKNNKNMGTYDN